jgi:hypothetical protein
MAGRCKSGLRSVAWRWLSWRARRIADPVERLRYLRLAAAHSGRRWQKGRVTLVALLLLGLALMPMSTITEATSLLRPELPPPPAISVNRDAIPSQVWLVEKTAIFEVFSNGLRIEVDRPTQTQPRRFVPVDRKRLEQADANHSLDVAFHTKPAGIVYHTSESHLPPFEASQNQALKLAGRGLLSYVRHNRSYHYLIDRFGRVYRVVEESDAANHAGASIWADHQRAYLNLNDSFLAIAFEAQTKLDGSSAINQAQIYAGAVLTQMLRAKYEIPAYNCITHAQVSVNPDNFRIGAHTDWAAGFPFENMGLPDNYALPVAGITLFGFSFDSVLVNHSGARMWKGLIMAQQQVREGASAQSIDEPAYRTSMRARYRRVMEAIRKRRGIS